MSTISSTISTGITLGTSGAYTSPLTITSTGGVENSGTGDAIFGPKTQAWTIDNAGTVSAAAIDSNGIYLGLGGYVDNRSTGLIAGVGYGVNIFRSGGTVVNAGTITASGTHGYGVSIYGGGLFTNSAGLVAATKTGVYIGDGNGTVSNFSTIQSTGTGTAGAAVVLRPHSGHAGSISNAATGMIIATGGTAVFNGLDAVYTAGTVTIDNAGTIASAHRDGIDLRAGNDLVTNNGSAALIAGYRYGIYGKNAVLTVSNSGTIENTGSLGDEGIFFYNTGGQVTNGATDNTTALIAGDGGGIRVLGTAAVTVDNFATISASSNFGRAIELQLGVVINGATNDTAALLATQNYGYGVQIDGGGGTVSNFATILGGVNVGDAAFVANGMPGLTTAQILVNNYAGSGIEGGANTTVQNFATIAATGALGRGVRLDNGGSVYNAASGQISGGLYGVAIYGSAGTIVNLGTIRESGATRFHPAGVYATPAAVIVNGSAGGPTAMISGSKYGIDISYNGGKISTIANFGTIQATGTNGYGVYVHRAGITGTGTGTVVNETTVSLIGGANYGVSVRGTGGVVDNFGTIIATASGGRHAAVFSDTVVNTGSAALISGNQNGVVLYGYLNNSGRIVATGSAGSGAYALSGATIVDSGTISGTAHGVILEGANYQHDRLVVEAGYSITGGVYSFQAQYSDLELSGALGAVTASLDTLGTASFGTIVFGAAGNETLQLSNTAGTLGATITGFATFTDVIDLTAIGTDGTIASQSASAVTVTGSLGSVTLQLDGSDSANLVTNSDGLNGTDLAVACFCRGTRILTARSEVPVEDLAIGDAVVTLSGETRPIKWIGRRAYDPRFVVGARNILPIRIAAGALGNGLPARDLCVSPEHAMYLDGALVAARLLVNGTTILQPGRVAPFEYFHVELDAHDIILAEGAPTESYVECDNRGMFHNAAEFAWIYPGEGGSPPRFCAPRLDEGSPELAAIRAGVARSVITPVAA